MAKYEPMKNASKKILFDDTPALKQKDRTRTKAARHKTEILWYRAAAKKLARGIGDVS